MQYRIVVDPVEYSFRNMIYAKYRCRQTYIVSCVMPRKNYSGIIALFVGMLIFLCVTSFAMAGERIADSSPLVAHPDKGDGDSNVLVGGGNFNALDPRPGKQQISPLVVTPEWQVAFLRKLSGGGGVIAIAPSVSVENSQIKVVDALDINSSVSLSLQNNNELKSYVEAVKSKYWEKMGAYSQYLPTVNLDLAVGDERSRPASYNDLNGDRVTDNTHLRRDRNLLVRQPLIDLSVIADVLSAKDKQNLSELEKDDTKNTVVLGTVSSYLKILQSQVAIHLADEYKTYLDELIKIMEVRVQNGGSPAADLDRVLSRSNMADAARMEAQAEFDINMAEFSRLTGAAPLRIQVPASLVPPIPRTVAEAARIAIAQNPKYLMDIKKIDLAKDDRNKGYVSVAPKIYAQFNGNYSYDAGGAKNANPVDGVYETQRTDSAMIVAQWQLNGLTPAATVLSSMAKEKQSYFQSLDTRQKIEQALSANYTAVKSTRNRLEVLQKTVEANERVVQGFEEQYKNGTRPLFDLLDAYEQLYNSRLNLTRVIFAHAQASYQIRQQMGDVVSVLVGKRG